MAVLPGVKVFGIDQEKFGILMIAGIQVVLIILFGVYVRYENDVSNLPKYPMFMDVHVMIFIGFGFLMTFLKRYAFSAVGFTYLIAALLIQWALLSDGFYNLDEHNKIKLSLYSLLKADVAVAAALISMGAVLGRTTYIQVIAMGILETALYSANNYLNTTVWKVSDAGASIFVHTLGAYFGLAVSFILNLKKKEDSEELVFESTYTSDTFAMIGTVFLWLFWPSFNAAELEGASQQRAIINTYISLASCCVAAFLMSWLIGREKKFDMVHVQNSTLAGGVAVGATADLMIQPYGAMIIGVVAAVISVFGYSILTPFLERTINLPDTCGINNLHGMPGVFAALLGVVMAAVASSDMYPKTLYEHYPAMAPVNNSLGLSGDGRTAGQQAGYQFLALIATIVIAIIGGVITGMVLNNDAISPQPDLPLNIDDPYWKVSDAEKPVEYKKPVFKSRQFTGSATSSLTGNVVNVMAKPVLLGNLSMFGQTDLFNSTNPFERSRNTFKY